MANRNLYGSTIKNNQKSAPAKPPKHYTLLLLPDENRSPIRFFIPRKLLIIIASIIFCIVGGVSAIIVDYVKLQKIVVDYERLRIENHSIRSEAAAIISRLESVQSSLNKVDSFSSKIREISKPEGSSQKKPKSKGKSNSMLVPNIPYQQMPIGPVEKEDYRLSKEMRARSLQVAKEVNFDKLEFKDTFKRLLEIGKQSETKARELERLLGDVQAYQAKISITPTLAPARGYVSSIFGQRESPFGGREQMHWGLDIAGFVGAPVYAAAAGTVILVRHAEDYGRHIEIDHGNGIRTKYAHLNKAIIKSGDKVIKGEVIAEMGDTGRSTGPHLHYEVEVNGRRVDPAAYIHDW